MEYRAARDRLLEQEIALRRAMEAVAEARRALPPGGLVPQDYAFHGLRDGVAGEVRFSQLFTGDRRSLAVYSFMFPRDPGDTRPGPDVGATALLPLGEGPCPSCTALLDQLEGAAEHVAQRMDLAIVARAPLERLLAFARERGYRRLRMFSSALSDYPRDYHGESSEGRPSPMMNVFHREGSAIRHTWGSEMLYAQAEPGQDPRHLGPLEPLWNLLDLTPEGRPRDWEEQLGYCCHARSP